MSGRPVTLSDLARVAKLLEVHCSARDKAHLAPKGDPKGTRIFHKHAKRYESELEAAHHRDGLDGVDRLCERLLAEMGEVGGNMMAAPYREAQTRVINRAAEVQCNVEDYLPHKGLLAK
jgi:hypothetical protein